MNLNKSLLNLIKNSCKNKSINIKLYKLYNFNYSKILS